jgi:drug/metabolite transporter (DMT)-like permease
VTIWGVSFIATKLALREIEPLQVIWIRFGIGVLVLGGVVAVRKEFRLPSADELRRFAILGFVGITFHQWLQVTGLKTAQASTTAWIVSTSPVFIAVLGWILLREQMDPGKSLGMLLAAAGVLGVVSRGFPSVIAGGHFGSAGDGLVLGSALTWAIFSVFSRKYLKAQSATLMLLFVMLFGWICTSVLLFLSGRMLPDSALSGEAIAALLFLGVFCSGIAYIFWYDALRVLPASQVGSLLFFEPLITIVAAALMLDEAMSVGALIGGGMILGGVWLVTRPRHTRA